MQQAVFIEPVGDLLHFLSQWKCHVAAERRDQPYLSHPPHATILVSAVTDTAAWRTAIAKFLRDMEPVDLRILRPFAFFDDPGTGGGHTLALEVETTPRLMELQSVVAEASLPFVDQTAISPPAGFQERDPCRSSVLKWGYPFVGPHWRPHFSVASLRAPREDPLIVQFLAERAVFNMRISEVGLWNIDKDTHTRLGAAVLQGRPSP